jgi:Protein of unknown function (DUF3467)
VEDEGPAREINVDVDIPPEVRRGVYANSFNVWFSPYEFALDWGVTDEAEAEDPDDPASPLRIPIIGVARVRLPTTRVFDVLRELNQALTRYESIFGEIRRPEAR